MKKILSIFLFSTAFTTFAQQTPQKILVLGNDMARGREVVNPERNLYTSQLRDLLGDQIEIKTLCFEDELFYMHPKLTDSIAAYAPDQIVWELGSQDEIALSGMKYKKVMREVSAFQKELTKSFPQVKQTFLYPTDKIEPFSEYHSLLNVVEADVKAVNGEILRTDSVVPNRTPFLDKKYQPTSLGSSYIAWNLFVTITNQPEANSAAVPRRGCEYRSTAGWKEGEDWHSLSDEINRKVARPLDLLLIGNSLTQGFGGTRELVVYKPGQQAAEKAFAGLEWETAAISGDKVQHVLYRIMHGNYEQSKAKHIVLTVGVNNLPNEENTPEEVAEGIELCVKELTTRFPESRIYVLGPLPASNDPTSDIRQAIVGVHAQLKQKTFGKNARYVDPTSWFTQGNGMLNTELFVRDQMHLSPKGYEVWASKIKDLMD